MAIYNLSFGKLELLIDRSFSSGTEHAIIDAIKSAGIVTSGLGPTGVEVETKGGSYAIPDNAKIFLDTGSYNTVTITDKGAELIAAGDASNKVFDEGPGGDTLVGGAGADWLTVKHGENVLIAGSGANTLVGGAGHDTLIGGGSSLLEAGSGGSTLLGGLADPPTSADDGERGSHRHVSVFAPSDDDHSDGHSQRFESASTLWDTLRGGQGDDQGERHSPRHGSAPAPSDTLKGGQGDDVLRVFHGDNLLIAGSGHDTLSGGDGRDTIFGGGHDTINLNYGDEFVQGGQGSDEVNIGLHGNDVIYGGKATTVHTDQTTSSIKSEVDVHGVTTITFSNHQVLTVSNVTIEFADGHKTNVH